MITFLTQQTSALSVNQIWYHKFPYASWGEGWGVWDRHVHTAVFNMQNQQGPAEQHREPRVTGQPGWAGSLGEHGCTCVRPSPLAAHLQHHSAVNRR